MWLKNDVGTHATVVKNKGIGKIAQKKAEHDEYEQAVDNIATEASYM